MRTDTVWTKTYERPWIVAAIAAGTVATLFLLFAPKAEAQYGGEIRGDRQELRRDRWDRNGDWADVQQTSTPGRRRASASAGSRRVSAAKVTPAPLTAARSPPRRATSRAPSPRDSTVTRTGAAARPGPNPASE